jgi:hypothetical protein
VVAYRGNQTEDLSDFQSEPIAVLGTFSAANLSAGDVLSFDVTHVYNQLIRAGASSLGIRLQSDTVTGIPFGATTFTDFTLTVVQQARVVRAPAGLLGPETDSRSDIHFGNYQPAAIRGRMWHDVDANGQWETDETPLNGWTVELIDEDGQAMATAVTTDVDFNGDGQIDPGSESGWFELHDVTPGSYLVRPAVQDGWVPTAPLPSEPNLMVESGVSRLDLDFGLTQLRVYFVQPSPNPRAEPVEAVDIAFTHAVEGFQLEDLQLVRTNDRALEIALAEASLATPDQINWTVGNLGSVTSVAGIYELILDASEAGIVETSSGSALITDGSIRWINGPGDVDVNGLFNQLDIVQVLQWARYLAGAPANWSQGDWTGNDEFGREDLEEAIDLDHYLQGPFGTPASLLDPLAVDLAIGQLDETDQTSAY